MSIGFGKIVRQIWNRFRPFIAFESVREPKEWR